MLHLLKKTLQDNLSLSSKLFLRELITGSRKGIASSANAVGNLVKRGGDAAVRLGLKPPRRLTSQRYDLKVPAAPEFDLSIPIDSLGIDRAVKREPDQVRTSIVIPVFNKAGFTFQCLRSLLREINLDETEILVVNNASTDDTKQVLEYFGDFIRVLNNEENRGFVESCNQGAAAARGNFLVFLNNDTDVLPDWLEQLLKTVEGDSSVGAVGSLFLYPDGSIQEAGAIVWRNGEAHRYGWSASPDDRRFNFAREVDYCSAASLLIKKEIFDQLGGFDRRYAPAYYEDVDLCFGVRSLGYKVIYQPASRLVRFAGVTAGSDTTAGLKKYQITNREKFIEKWRTVLEREHLPQDLKQLEEASDRNRDRIRVIVFDERVPSPDRDAGSLRMFTILKTLARSSRVVFVPFNRPQSSHYERDLWQEGIETADAVDYRGLLSHKNVKTAIVSRPSMGSVFIHRIRRANANIGIVFDMVDTHFVRFQREYEVSHDPVARAQSEHYRKLEKKLAQSSDVVWCASGEDKEVMAREVPATRIEIVTTIHELRDSGKPFADRHDLLFIGNLAHRPNEDSVLFFLREVWPLVNNSLPTIKLDIIGDNASPAIKACHSDDVRIRGYVPDVQPYLRERRVFVAPLRFGAGIKGKVGEAMAYGIPVVTTSIGAEGFGLTHGVDVMLADDPTAFAAEIARLYTERELWETIARNAQLRIQENFTPDVIQKAINNSVRESFAGPVSGGNAKVSH